ncbi:cyclic nucleotide-gated ion channel 1-like [Ananas comosus]|uniref:Cyclic nucleotide-gated ion channel 1-like n=1 Tax=Ananas comosus TaxID=4615 RepID=A0A6P5FKR8_ANACO|nr:cyclic nucleotide-gated ion channel 1-like [Ananas comosus]XP_020096927.1 cyclic nucleotide-gated ion channel 1-like [Ananas comosus]
MTHQEGKFVRFQDWSSEQSVSSDRLASGSRQRRFASLTDVLRRGIEWFRNILHYQPVDNSSPDEAKSRKKALDPQGPFLQKWNKIFVLSCVIAVSVDPLFFYIPFVDSDRNCFDLDRKLEITASVLRFFTDIFYILHIIFQFQTGFIAPSSRVFGRGVLVEDPAAIAKRYISSYFIIDIFAVLPLPQVIILIVFPKLQGSEELLNAKNVLMFIVIFQYLPRLVRIIPLYLEITRSAGIIAETAWTGAAFNLLLYMLASHVLGALWYLLSIQREDTCWREACGQNNCDIASLYCGAYKGQNNTFLAAMCPINTPNVSLFNFGIYQPALQNVVQSTTFFEKLFYCFWWGLQNLSSLGQNLRTSTYTWENLFAVFISISALILFALLIGNMQTYLQSTSVRIEEMRIKRRDAEQWMSHRLLPESIKERIRRHEQYRWQETRGVDEEHLLLNLPKDLRRDIKRHLCLSLLMRVPMFEKMDDQLLDAMCDRLKPVLYTEHSCIIREGDPVNEMLFIMRGNLESMTTNGGRTGFFNSDILKAGDFCGEELLTWALDPHSYSSLPSSTRTVKTLSEVEAFALMADDLKFVATQFRRLHSKQLQHTFRLYSQQWRTWAACFIQAAWRRYSRKKLEEALHEREKRLQAAIVSGGEISLSFGAALYASRFAGNMLRTLRRNRTRKARLQERLPAMLLQKPAEPDFFSEKQ